ncbi:MAG: DNA translocase FtsK 4TM domain-containing protein [Prevotellaceae bacterium]|nr:DNA translocase FtsK 4TM domain-containing protein [Prevotellaceae bacterium]
MAKKKNTRSNKTFSEVVGFKNIFQNDIINFIVGIVLFFLAIYIIIAFISFFTAGEADQSLVLDLRPGEIFNSDKAFQNSCGPFGAFISYFFISRCFGIPAFIIPVFMGMLGLRLVKAYMFNIMKCFFCMALVMIWSSIMAAKIFTPIMGSSIFNPGGDSGLFCSQWIENLVGTPGLLGLMALTAILFLTYLSKETITVVRKALNPVKAISSRVKFNITNDAQTKEKEVLIETLDDPEVFDDPETEKIDFPVDDEENEVEPAEETTEDKADKTTETVETSGNEEFKVELAKEDEKSDSNDVSNAQDLNVPINPKEPWTKYKYPTLDLLKTYENDGKPYIDMKEQIANKERIIKVLNNFGVQIKTISATVGPTITLYEITPADGVRISKIRNLEDDIALSLAALGIRIIAPIPGKGTIGIEVPNAKANIVSMESILNSKRFQETKMELPIAIGKTITNEVFMVDLAKLPHLLVAGATGQGKSVGLNAIITSLLYKKHPNELKFVLIDPKKVEFSIYAPIADHFMAKVPDDNEEPIITDVKKVIRTLNSLCKLMDTRYDLLKAAGAKNIIEYNKKYVNHQLRLTDGHEYMPYIVVIIDEFGDLIMTAGKEIEMPIARIAQLARAVGIHMVIATQRPTTSIITGNIKANFPGRMAFRVSAMIDSRTILDRPGANQLIGRGDLLFLDKNEPVRVQCAFVDTPEIEDINKYISQQPGPLEPMELPEPATDEDSGAGGGGSEVSNLDPLFEDAARAIVLSQQGSTSMIQRRFSIGYNRAGRLMDQLEKTGVVGAAQGSKPREVLILDENSLETLLARYRK